MTSWPSRRGRAWGKSSSTTKPKAATSAPPWRAGGAGAAVEEVELYDESQADDFRARLAREVDGGGGGAAGGEQVVDDDDALAFHDGVLVQLERVGTVLELVGDFVRLGWQLFRLAHR